MALTNQDVEQIAQLARLELTPEKIELYKNQLTAILTYADQLAELDLDDVAPTTHAVPVKNITRADIVEEALSAEQIVANATRHADNQFIVQAVLDE